MTKKSGLSFICPVCNKKLIQESNSFTCASGHCFDVSKYGYVNLLLANKMNSHDPGDDKDMVKSRASFLEKDYYRSLRTAIEQTAIKYTDKHAKVLDLGCGEGYYTAGLLCALNQADKSPDLYGVDISKAATKLAAKKCNQAHIAVASVFHLPIENESIDLMLNCFSPLCTDEINRCLKHDGVFLYVVPGQKHLWQLKCALYDKPYENERKDEEYSGLTFCGSVHIKEVIHLKSGEDIKNLFQMTPYCWKTSQHDRDKLFSKNELDTQIEFYINIYKKN
ncbi:MAG: methyltransferase domain-containing protein [Oscillospiraceae bacterium]